jgi:hypothetical protein
MWREADAGQRAFDAARFAGQTDYEPTQRTSFASGGPWTSCGNRQGHGH